MKQLSYLSLLALITMKAMALPSDPRGQEILAEGQNRRLSHVTSSEFDILVSIGLREPAHAQCMERFRTFPLPVLQPGPLPSFSLLLLWLLHSPSLTENG